MESQAIGLSRGGQTTKVHALTDTLGRPHAFDLTPGNVSDMKAAGLLLHRAEGARYCDRHRVENAFCDIKDFRRVATRYDKLARNFPSTVALAILVRFWP